MAQGPRKPCLWLKALVNLAYGSAYRLGATREGAGEGRLLPPLNVKFTIVNYSHSELALLAANYVCYILFNSLMMVSQCVE